jgi:chromosome segregation ATPase
LSVELEKAQVRLEKLLNEMDLLKSKNNQLIGDIDRLNKVIKEKISKCDQLESDKAKMVQERESRGNEILELQQRLCTALDDKESLLKDIIAMKQECEPHKKQIKQLEHQIKEAKDMINELEQKSQGSSNQNEEMLQKLEKQINANIEQKLDTIIEEKYQLQNEVESLKTKVVILKFFFSFFIFKNLQKKNNKIKVE